MLRSAYRVFRLPCEATILYALRNMYFASNRNQHTSHSTGGNVQEELRHRWLRPTLVAAGVIVLDQVTKAWILRTLGPVEGSNIPLLGSWLEFVLVKNNGVAFGLFQNIPYFFTITSVLISVGAI